MKEAPEVIVMREFRARNNLKQEDVAKHLNVSRQMYSIAERHGWKGLSEKLKNAIIEHITNVEGYNPFELKTGSQEGGSPTTAYGHLKNVVLLSQSLSVGERRIVLSMIRWCLEEVTALIEDDSKGEECLTEKSLLQRSERRSTD